MKEERETRKEELDFASPRPYPYVIHQTDFLWLRLYSPCPIQENHMSEAKPIKAVPAVELFGLNSPAKTAQNKKTRDERRKAIRSQNARSRIK
jgi:hypothetical protein